MEALRTIPVIATTVEAVRLAEALLAAKVVPVGASRDALHIAVAATQAVSFLLTWNFTHIANATIRDRIAENCRTAGFEPPVICTPDELFEEKP